MITTFSDYEQLARRTMKMDGDTGFHKMVAGLGLTGEVAEIAHILFRDEGPEDWAMGEMEKEIGDSAWYCMFVANLYGIEVKTIMVDHLEDDDSIEEFERAVYVDIYQEFFDQDAEDMPLMKLISDLVVNAGSIADTIKKEVGHGHSTNLDKIVPPLARVWQCLSTLCSLYGLDFGITLQANINKLKKRFPNGFSSEDSIKRVDVGE